VATFFNVLHGAADEITAGRLDQRAANRTIVSPCSQPSRLRAGGSLTLPADYKRNSRSTVPCPSFSRSLGLIGAVLSNARAAPLSV
jgi:hypothetical protein